MLQRAGVAEARQVIITTDRDDSNVLATLTVRQLNADAWIVASVREHENAPLMKQSGASSVITSSDAVGRLLGLSSLSPTLGAVMEDLLTYGEGLEVAERDLLVSEVGQQPQSLPDQVIAVVRDENVYRYFDPVGHPAGPRRPADRRTAGARSCRGRRGRGRTARRPTPTTPERVSGSAAASACRMVSAVAWRPLSAGGGKAPVVSVL